MSNLRRVQVICQHLSPADQKNCRVVSPCAAMSGGPGPLTTHILDTARGCPAANVPIKLFIDHMGSTWKQIAEGRTNADGRCPGLLTQEQFHAATYKIFFDTGAYFSANQLDGFYPYVEVVFEIKRPEQHHHVPLLLSPYGYSTYRGS